MPTVVGGLSGILATGESRSDHCGPFLPSPVRRIAMLSIPYETETFQTGTVANGTAELPVTWDDILWAAVTVGRPNRQYVFRHGVASMYEALFRWSLVRMSLEQSGPRASLQDGSGPYTRPVREGCGELLSRLDILQAIRCEAVEHALASSSGRVSPGAQSCADWTVQTGSRRPSSITQPDGTPSSVRVGSVRRVRPPKPRRRPKRSDSSVSTDCRARFISVR